MIIYVMIDGYLTEKVELLNNEFEADPSKYTQL
jgi:hypothetical protein